MCFKKDENSKMCIVKLFSLFEQNVQKVRKIWSKTGSPKVHIPTLKASLEPYFFGTHENRCVKRPRLRSMCPPLISRPQKSLNLRRTNGRTSVFLHSPTERHFAQKVTLIEGDADLQYLCDPSFRRQPQVFKMRFLVSNASHKSLTSSR